MKNPIVTLTLSLLAAGHFAQAHAATHVVSPGQSIQAALDRAVAGDTVQVLAGTYKQKVSVSGKTGAANALITLRGEPGAIISGAGLKPSGREGLVTIRNSKYVRVEGFSLTGLESSGANTPVGILVDGHGANLQIVGNKIYGIKHTSKCGDPCEVGAHGLAVFGTSKTGITDLLIQDNEVYGNVLQSSEAFVINGNVDRFEVIGNNVHDNNNIGYDFIGYEGECSGCGELDRVRNGIVRNNRAVNNSSKSNPWYGGEGSAAGFYVDGGRFIIFDGNVSSGNDMGFEFASEHANKATEDILMINNFVFANREAGLSVGGYSSRVGQARRIYVNNNSFYKNQGWGTEITFQYKVIDSQFNNNIIYGETSIRASYANQGSGHSGNIWGRNHWWAPSTGTTSVPGTRIISDPRYVDPANGNLRLQASSPAIGQGLTGAPLTGWTSPLWSKHYPSFALPANGNRDKDGEARIEGGSLDVGADEFGTAPAI